MGRDRNQTGVSVVVAAFSGEDAVVECLQCLEPQREQHEILVAINAEAGIIARLELRFPSVQFVRGPLTADVFKLRSLGIDQSKGQVIVLTEDHCSVAPQWIASFTATLAAGHKIAAGSVRPKLSGGIFDWALYFCEYISFMPPVPQTDVSPISAVNAAYDRDELLRCRAIWQDGFYDNEVHDAFQSAGHAVCFVADAGVESRLAMSLREAILHLFIGGRRFGGYRRFRSRHIRRAFWIAAAPLVPLVLLARIIRIIIARHPRRLIYLVAGMPYMTCLLLAWSIGEASGYISRTDLSRVNRQHKRA